MATQYYDDYIQDTILKRKDMDKIHFGNVGIKELKSRSLHNINMPQQLKKQIQSGQKMRPRYDYPRDDISSFEIINNSYNNKDYEYQIARDNIQGNKFYNIKDVSDKTDSFSTNRNQNPASRKSPIDIILPTTQNLNPNLENISKKPRPFGDWLEELKRKRRLKGW